VRQHSIYRPGEAFSRPWPGAFSHPAALGGAGLAGDDRVEVDSRFHLQRDYLGVGLGSLGQTVQYADVAWRAQAGHGFGDPGSLLAADSVFDSPFASLAHGP